MKKELNGRQLYQRLLTYVRPYWAAFLVALTCMALSSLAEPVFPALMKYLLDDGFSKTSGPWGWVLYPLAILGVFLVRAIFGFIGDYAMSWVANNVVTELRQVMFAKMLQLPSSYFGDNLSGRLISRITYDVTNVSGAATGALTTLVKDSLSIFGLLAWLLYLNWKLTLVTVVMVPFMAIAVRAFSGRLRRASRGLQELQGTITQILQESIEGFKVIKIFGGQSYEIDRFRTAVRDQRALNLRITIAASAQGPIVQFCAAVALATIMAAALQQAANDQTSVGSFVSFVTAMLMVLAPLKRLTDVSAPIQRGLAAAESVFALIDEAPEDDRGNVRLERVRGDIQFDKVTFSYPGAERRALDQLSLTVSAGQCVALVGQSGSGKTTIANLIPRLYHVDAGEIRIDGQRIEDISLKCLRQNIAVVSQEVVLFNDTVAANIAYGLRRDIGFDEIRCAADAAHALEFIEALPAGFNTLIGENGIKLSGGQRQRLAIARALLKDSPILILDEATSALDTESERQVKQALDTLMQGRTTLVIAHRLSTVENADRIVVLDKGRIVEAGRHCDLLALNGVYARLHSLQEKQEGAA